MTEQLLISSYEMGKECYRLGMPLKKGHPVEGGLEDAWIRGWKTAQLIDILMMMD